MEGTDDNHNPQSEGEQQVSLADEAVNSFKDAVREKPRSGTARSVLLALRYRDSGIDPEALKRELMAHEDKIGEITSFVNDIHATNGIEVVVPEDRLRAILSYEFGEAGKMTGNTEEELNWALKLNSQPKYRDDERNYSLAVELRLRGQRLERERKEKRAQVKKDSVVRRMLRRQK